MPVIELFDVDMNMQVDPLTRDLKTLNNEDAVNQSIDLFITNPRRIGVGLSNTIFEYVFSDVSLTSVSHLTDDIKEQFKQGYPLLTIKTFIITPEPTKRRLKVYMEWSIDETTLTGVYTRYWNQP